MMFRSLFNIFRKALGEARWGPHGDARSRFEIFRILFTLHYHVDIRKTEGEARVRIFGNLIFGPSYFELLYLFREIFIERQYEVKFKNSSPYILDCGANIGMATIFFKRLAPECSVVCFEPNPRAFHYLKKNLEGNNVANVQLENVGVSDQAGEMAFFVDQSNTLISSHDQHRGPKNQIKVTSVALSAFVESRKIDFVKIDVEGAEWLVLKDLIATEAVNNIEELAIEYHHNISSSGNRLGEFLSMLEVQKFKYRLSAKINDKSDYQDILIRAHKA